MNSPTDDLENRLAGCRPQLEGVLRDRLLFQAAQASLKKSICDRTVSYVVLSSLLSAAACFGIMTFAVNATVGENKIADMREQPHTQRPNPFDSEFQSELEARPHGVLTATSWARWEALERQVASASQSNEARSSDAVIESKPLSARSKVTSF